MKTSIFLSTKDDVALPLFEERTTLLNRKWIHSFHAESLLTYCILYVEAKSHADCGSLG